MAKSVIDLFQAVDIHDDECKLRHSGRHLHLFALHDLLVRRLVLNTGQGIRVCQFIDIRKILPQMHDHLLDALCQQIDLIPRIAFQFDLQIAVRNLLRRCRQFAQRTNEAS